MYYNNERLYVIVILVLIFMAITYVIIKIIDRKIKKRISMFPEETVNKVKNSVFYECRENPNFVIGTCMIFGVKEDSGCIEIKLLYYNHNAKKFMTNVIYMNKEEFQMRNLKAGDIVNTLHNGRSDLLYKVLRIM